MSNELEEIRRSQKQRLDSGLKELEVYLLQYDFKFVLIYLFLIENFELFTKSGSIKDDPILITYVADLYLTYNIKSKKELPDKKVLDEIIEKLKDIYLTYMFILNTLDGKNELAQTVSTDSLLVKRSFFIGVFYRTNRSIIDIGSEYFKHNFGFSILDIFKLRESLMQSIVKSLNEKGSMTVYCNLLDIDISKLSNEMHVTVEEVENMLKYYSVLSTNNEVLLPRRDNPLIFKPIIFADCKYFCINPLSLVENLRKNMEYEIKKSDSEWQRYCKKRGKILESIVYENFKEFFKNGKFYKNLKYKFYSNESLYETDLLIEADQYLLIIESKSGSLSERAVSGYKERLDRDINELVLNAHEQCKRTLKYLDSCQVAVFLDGEDEIKIKKSNYEKIYLISITLDNLEIITANIHKILEVQTNVNIVTLSIYDLSVIMEILRGPSEFLLYLDRRERSIMEGKLNAHDELDIFSAFLEMGLYFNIEEKYNIIDVTNFSDDIEKYYIIGPQKVKKPGLRLNYQMRKIVETLENENRLGNIAIAKELISFCSDAQNEIAKNYNRLLKKISKKGRSDFSLESNETKTGITFYGKNGFSEGEDLPQLIYYVHTKLKEKKCVKWYLIVIIDIKNGSNYKLYRFT